MYLVVLAHLNVVALYFGKELVALTPITDLPSYGMRITQSSPIKEGAQS